MRVKSGKGKKCRFLADWGGIRPPESPSKRFKRSGGYLSTPQEQPQQPASQETPQATGPQAVQYPFEPCRFRPGGPNREFVAPPGALAGRKPGLSFAILDDVAYRISDNAAADALQQARRTLFTTIYEQEQKRA